MAGSFSNWAENAVLNLLFGGASDTFSTATANYYVGLCTATPTDTGVSTKCGECAGSTYARVAIANSSASWANCTGGIKLLKVAATMTTAAGSDWGTIKGLVISDVASGAGNIIVWSTLTGGAKVVNSGDTVIVSTGFSITLT
jgi:hypothetical protein